MKTLGKLPSFAAILRRGRVTAEHKDRAIARAYRAKRAVSIKALEGEQKASAVGQRRAVLGLTRRFLTGGKSRSILSGLEKKYKIQVLTSKARASILLDGLVHNRKSNWVPISLRLRRGEARKIRVSQFSFLHNANGTMKALKQIAEAEATCLNSRIDFLDTECSDLGPWLVLAVMRPEMAPIFTGGHISGELSSVIRALQLHKPLRFSLQGPGSENSIWAFPLRSRRPAGSSRSETVFLDPQAYEVVTDELCDALDQWLSASARCQLSLEGRRIVRKIVGETLDNAERHSRPDHPNDGDWSISGFMEQVPCGDGTYKYRCRLAFLSVGASISQTVQRCDAITAQEMSSYVKRHERYLKNHTYAADHLRTIYALQDTVSGDADAILNGRGGTGFRDIISFFGDLAAPGGGIDSPKLAIVSGRSCIYVDSRYYDVARPLPTSRFNIWLNLANDENLPPDDEAVLELVEPLNGTLVTMSFMLDRDYLKNVGNGTR